MPNGQKITIDGSNSGQAFNGDSNQFTMAAGAWIADVSGASDVISGGTGPNTYVVASSATGFGNADSITVGSGGGKIAVAGDWTQITVTSPAAVKALINGNSSTLVTSGGTLGVVANGTSNSFVAGSGAEAFLLTGSGNVVQGDNTSTAVGFNGTGNTIAGNGDGTYAFLAGSVGAGSAGPVLGAFNPAQGHLSILLSSTSSPGAGLTDTGLSPQAFLTASQFQEGSAATQASTRFVYNPSTGALTYTPGGSTSGTVVPVAVLPTGLTLSASNIFISNEYVYGAPAQNVLDGLGAFGVTDPQPTATPAANFAAKDTTTGVASTDEPGQAYSGPVNYLQQEFIYSGSHAVSVTAKVNNVFIKGAGNEALAAHGGDNVLDGGLGSNFLVGGTGADGSTDTFFTDARTSAFVWNTVVNFHVGDIVTLYGFTAGKSSYTIAPSEGAQGYQGLTVNADIAGNGQVTAKVTLTNLTTADLSHLVFSTGTVSNIPYLAISNT
jgi:Ca2+-binding RTX toxin-like protein